MTPDMNAYYLEDLAYIHHTGFGGFAQGAAPGLLALLKEAGIRDGFVVDLGCGSGIWARALRDAGYEVLGVDSSAPMIDLARRVAPGARFECASVHDLELPSCNVVTALGEVLSYIPAGAEDLPPLANIFQKVGQALKPGGLFLFDVFVHEPGRPMAYRSWSAGEDWAVLVDVREQPQERLLTRGITTFRRIGEGYRRSEEEHRVRVLERKEIADELRRAGFSVRTSRRYGHFELPPRRAAFRARRPQRRGSV